MTILNTRTKTARGNLKKVELVDIQSEKIEMTLNTDSAIASGLLIQRLTELYENPIEASVRETISNGFDALAISAKKGAAIRITSPSMLNPIFTVEDNGVGMTYEDLKNVYSKYGASTKQNNFDQIGAYGLGAKAPLAYGTQFTVASVKEGQKTIIIVVREEMTNYIKVIDSFETDEPSGTIVSIPVQSEDIEKFNRAINVYKVTPADYSAEMYIDDELVDESKKGWTLLTEKMPIHGGTVLSKVWVKNLRTMLSNYFSNKSQFSSKIKKVSHVVGGWGYDNPAMNMGYLPSEVFVELKPGLVSFNSSRDAILENDRVRELNEEIKEYFDSSQFGSELKCAIENSSKEDFTKHMSLFYSNFKSNLEVTPKSITFGDERDEVLSYKNKESGYSILAVFELCQKTDLNIASFRVVKHARQVRQTVYRLYPKPSRLPICTESTLSQMSEKNERLILGNSKIDNILEQILVQSSLTVESNRNERQIFVTEIGDGEEGVKSHKKIVRLRERISALAYGVLPLGYDVTISVVDMKNEDFKNLLTEANISNPLIHVFSLSEITEKTKAEKRVRAPREKKPPVKLDKISFYTVKNGSTKFTPYSEMIQDTKPKIFGISDSPRNLESLISSKTWYCNENDLSLEDISLYFVSNSELYSSHIELLSEFGDIYAEHKYVSLRNSNAVRNHVAGKALSTSSFYKKDPLLKAKRIAALLEFSCSISIKELAEKFASKIEQLNYLSSLTGIDIPEVSMKGYEVIKNLCDQKITTFHMSREELKVIIGSLTKEEIKILDLISIINTDNCNGNYGVISGDAVIRKYMDNDFLMELGSNEENKKKYEATDLFADIKRSTTTAKFKFILKALEEISSLEIN